MPTILDRSIAAILPAIPKPLVRFFSSPYIAGETMDDAARVADEMKAAGIDCTMDILGEHVDRREQALAYTEGYISLLKEQASRGLGRNISIKLTMLGLQIDRDFCLENMRRIVAAARERDTKIRIDMEDSNPTDDTIAIFRKLRVEYPRIGIVLQAYMHRCLDDVISLGDLTPDYRLCKGIYIEPPELAIQDRDGINENFLKVLGLMWEKGSFVGIATHDVKLVEGALRMIRERGLGHDRYEFQMLLGVLPRLRERIVREGHPMRVYIPFGEDWYAYSVRRLQENPSMAGHILRSILRSIIRR